ncbi:MAG: ABC transporter ATP-binding protein/permease, partial [archaeon]|nr:ABC transporter ATP-binding protein/permease [archaeon]
MSPPELKPLRPKKIWPSLKRLLNYFGKYRIHLAVLIIVGLISNALTVLGPQYLSEMTDLVSDSLTGGTPVDLDAVFNIGMILVGLYLLIFVIGYVTTSTCWIVEERGGDKMRIELARKVSKVSVGDMDKLRSGDIMSRFVNDTDTIRVRAFDAFVNTIEAIAMYVFTIVMMFLTEWRLAILAILPSLAGFLIMKVIVKRSQKYYRAQSRNLGKLNNLIEETYRGMNVVNAFNGMDKVRENFTAVNTDLYDTALKARFMGGLLPASIGFLNNLSYVLVCIVGAIFILNGESTFGVLVAFIVYVKLSNQPLGRLSFSLTALQEVSAACERVFEFFDLPEMDDESAKDIVIKDVKGRVEFDDVCFSYVPGREVIHGLNLNVSPGQKIAIVGPTGAGKTTLSNLLLRFYDPDSGSISIDGVKLTDMKRENVRDLFSVVLQETWLFKGTLRQNVVFGKEGYSDEEILRVCEAVGLKQFISSLSDGIDTYIEDPMKLSSGQRQQITIARAMIKS